MIAGRPPFNGENHIDLLRNIQHKAVRLPPDVRVSKACVNLLRVLLNRNPLSRAGFKEFFEACDAFVALGCEGVVTPNSGSCRIPTNDLGTIPENEGNPGSESLMTVATTSQPHSQQHQTHSSSAQPYGNQSPAKPPRIVSPALGPTPHFQTSTPHTARDPVHQTLTRQLPHRLAPLTQSPPLSAIPMTSGMNMPSFSSLGQQARQPWQHPA
jgi:serine/threonine protein kinase